MAKTCAIIAAGLESTVLNWIKEGFSYSKICEKLLSEFGVKTYPASITNLKFNADLKEKEARKKAKPRKVGRPKAEPENNPPNIESPAIEPDGLNARERLLRAFDNATLMLANRTALALTGKAPLPYKEASFVEKLASILAKESQAILADLAAEKAVREDKFLRKMAEMKGHGLDSVRVSIVRNDDELSGTKGTEAKLRHTINEQRSAIEQLLKRVKND